MRLRTQSLAVSLEAPPVRAGSVHIISATTGGWDDIVMVKG